MDNNQDGSHVVSLVSLLMIPTELLVYIISYILPVCERVKLRYVSRRLKQVIEGTPTLWKEFVWPYYDSCDKCILKEILTVCGQHIKVASFPYSKIPVEMLQYCSNVQHLSLPSIKLDPEQLKKIINNMCCLQTLELKVDDDIDTKQLLLNTSQLRELTIITNSYTCDLSLKLFEEWKESRFRPSSFNVVAPMDMFGSKTLIDYAAQITIIPTNYTGNFRVFSRSSKVPLNLSPALPYFQLQVEGSGQVTTPCVKLSDCGILGMERDLAVMTDCQYGGRTLYMVRHRTDHLMATHQAHNYIMNKIMDSMPAARYGNLSFATHFDLLNCQSLHSGHLEQLAIACPNLHRLNLQNCSRCLVSLRGLQAIASHCHNLQGLNLLNICISKVEDHILLWKILSNMKLTHLAVDFCAFISEVTNKEKLIFTFQNCWTIRAIQCGDCYLEDFTNEDALILSYFPSLKYCYLYLWLENQTPPTVVQDAINNCIELRAFYCSHYYLSLNLAYNHNLQQLYINSSNYTTVPEHFMTSVSAHGGLVHVIMSVRSLTAEGITSLVKNSPNLRTLYLCAKVRHVDVESFNASLKKMFWNRKLFTAGHYMLSNSQLSHQVVLVCWEQGVDLLPLWESGLNTM